jgi:hypothetical protein
LFLGQGWLDHRVDPGEVRAGAGADAGPEGSALKLMAEQYHFQVQCSGCVADDVGAFAGDGGAGEAYAADGAWWRGGGGCGLRPG